MNTSIKLGRIWGIPIGLHASWFIIFGLITWSLATGYFPREYPFLSVVAYLLMGLVTSLLFFASVLGHELGHSYLALRNKIPVRGITLFIFGGMAQIEREPSSPGVEFRVAIAGPVTSLLLALVFTGLYLLDRAVPFLAAPSEYLLRINLILAVFNLIPGFPLDGGRVLRAVVWKLTGSFFNATRWATLTGQIVSFGFIGFGLYSVIRGDYLNGVWMVVIGWFLQNAAASTYAQVKLENSMREVTVAQAMQAECIQISPLTPLSQIIDEYVLIGGHRCFYVSEGDQLVGMLTLRDIVALPEAKRRFTTAAQVMVPRHQLVKVNLQSDLFAAMQAMDSAKVAQVPVVDQGRLVGTLSREHVLHYLRIRAQLKS